MFEKTIKLTRRGAAAIIIAAACALTALILVLGALGNTAFRSPDSGQGLMENSDRVEYLASLGWQVEPEPISEETVVIPKQFGDVYESYNELQKQQGFDLSEFCGLEATVYTYRVTSLPASRGEVLAVLYILNYRAIGGDVHSCELDGFMVGLK